MLGDVEVKVGEAGGPSGSQALPGCWEVNWVCPKVGAPCCFMLHEGPWGL